ESASLWFASCRAFHPVILSAAKNLGSFPILSQQNNGQRCFASLNMTEGATMVQEYAQFLQLCQSFAHNSARAPKVFRCMCCGNESGLKLRRCEIHAASQATVEKSGE